MNIDRNDSNREQRKTNSFIGILSAAGRTIIYRLTTFYLRIPLKLFRPPRFDYLHYLRVVYAKDNLSQDTKFYQRSPIHLLNHALNKYGWKVIPERILPPLLLNSVTGIVLYTTYLQTVSYSNKDTPKSSLSYYTNVYKAGWCAGVVQALVSSPIDAIFARQSMDELVKQMNKHDNLWKYGWKKWKQIGLVGCYGGFLLTLFKESFGFGTYFWSFEYIKEHYKDDFRDSQYINQSIIFVSGVTAAIFLQMIQYPISKIEKLHFKRLEAIDITIAATKPQTFLNESRNNWRNRHMHLYRNAYRETFTHLRQVHGGHHLQFVRWLYKGFLRNTAAVIPGTTAGLLFLNYLRSQTEFQPSLKPTQVTFTS
ncbi:similar to Torulaspora delbrueckii TDEL_0B05280 hypothetical protein [Maudiozyma barnettii]|uniref:Mitochondrial carrier protein n=1 Tax=Maudiozyma barnettii TaxID=61262 RepID=A0A8H2VDP5_9SACH|nr:uncharacterized protein KABA2_03S01496 [Kazachstania barnettii]CAB4253598.1 similar to Torulaspora delbrueckii TDEL_0B05280 hypothetical protein [Kazachstania barnettii]CAD1781272.1 similar to Torulaspora delbrueckii TDEL_0B05280 hypothetical protein [Kazachstania barnettii]